VSEELSVPLEHITIINNDSDVAPWDVEVHASRTTFIAGNGVRRAVVKAGEQILNAASQRTQIPATELDLREGHVVEAKNGTIVIKLERLLRQLHFQEEPELIMVTDYYESNSKPKGADHISDHSVAYSYAVHIAEVEVDTWTGEVRVEKITVAQDADRVINRMGP